jgi:hypothetical protein
LIELCGIPALEEKASRIGKDSRDDKVNAWQGGRFDLHSNQPNHQLKGSGLSIKSVLMCPLGAVRHPSPELH